MSGHLDEMIAEADSTVAEAIRRYGGEEEDDESWVEFLGDMLDFTGIGFFSPSHAGDPIADYLAPQLNSIASRHAQAIRNEIEAETGRPLSDEERNRLVRLVNDALNGYLLHAQQPDT